MYIEPNKFSGAQTRKKLNGTRNAKITLTYSYDTPCYLARIDQVRCDND